MEKLIFKNGTELTLVPMGEYVGELDITWRVLVEHSYQEVEDLFGDIDNFGYIALTSNGQTIRTYNNVLSVLQISKEFDSYILKGTKTVTEEVEVYEPTEVEVTVDGETFLETQNVLVTKSVEKEVETETPLDTYVIKVNTDIQRINVDELLLGISEQKDLVDQLTVNVTELHETNTYLEDCILELSMMIYE